MTPFNLEKTAYEYLRAAEVEGCIPHVYGYGCRTLSAWGLPSTPDRDGLYNAIVMEWIENAEQLSANNVNLDNACRLLKGLSKIHEAGVLHYDTFRRNLLVVPGTNRVLWIDFSCAHINEEKSHPVEMQGAAGVILEVVRPLFLF
jgi:predicted Ser/Thr protein kinase